MSVEAFLKAAEATLGAAPEDDTPTRFIDTGFEPLNEIISGHKDGGLPVGRVVEVFGESSTGKTALASLWMAETQRMGGFAAFEDWERSFNAQMASKPGIGLSLDAKSYRYNRPRTWEDGNKHATNLCELIREHKVIPDDAPILIVFDSIASAIPKSQAEKGIDEYTMNDTTALARVTSTTLKVQAMFAADYNATFLYLNQVRLKPGVTHGDPRYTSGGKAPEYYATTRLALSRSKIVEGTGSDKEFVGQEITIQCVKSKLTKPFQSTKMRMTFDDDGAARFDITRSLIDYGVEVGKLPSAGARVTWEGKSYWRSELAKKIDAESRQSELKTLIYG
jgi:protein RecA